jgi:hypothetical protein
MTADQPQAPAARRQAVNPLRPARPYSDTDALNDIHALLTSPAAPADVLQDVAAILARAGRPLFPSRVITATVADDPHGMPVARIEAEGTTIAISQAKNDSGLCIHIAPRDAAEEAALTIAVAGTVIRHPRPGPRRPAR